MGGQIGEGYEETDGWLMSEGEERETEKDGKRERGSTTERE